MSQQTINPKVAEKLTYLEENARRLKNIIFYTSNQVAEQQARMAITIPGDYFDIQAEFFELLDAIEEHGLMQKGEAHATR